MPNLKNKKADIQTAIRQAGYALSAIRMDGEKENNFNRMKDLEHGLRRALKLVRKFGVELSRKGLC